MTSTTTSTPPAQVRRIAIFRALFLGDLLMSAPAWRALRSHFPAAEISLIGLPWAEQLLAHMPGLIDRLVPFAGYQGIDEVPAAAERTARFLQEQRAHSYDLAIQMHGDGSVSNGFVQALGAKATLGFALPGDTRLTTSLPHHDDQNEVWRWLRLVAAAGAPAADARISFALAAPDVEQVRAILGAPDGERPLIGLHVGAKDPARRWPATHFAALGKQLRERTGARFVLTGGAAERPAVTVVRRQIGAPLTDLCARTSLGEFAAALAELDLLVTNDTGASHLAAALGVPSVVIFGPTRPARFAPLNGVLHRVVDALEHAPGHSDPEQALRALPVEPVLRAALDQLAAHRSHPAGAPLAAHAIER
jgi:ADP-heptose:LPS heptosyltransferase